MTRIELVSAEQAPLLARPYFADGDPGPIAAALALVPELLDVAMPFVGAALGQGALDPRTRELVILRTSAVAGCRYCVDTHTVVGRDLGLAVDEVRALRGEIELAAAFPGDRERAVLAWTDAVAGRAPIADGVHEALRRHLADHEIVELTVLAAATLLLNRFSTALELPIAATTATRLAEEGFERFGGER
jgi:AhpD family alkylhydroperoxidase